MIVRYQTRHFFPFDSFCIAKQVSYLQYSHIFKVSQSFRMKDAPLKPMRSDANSVIYSCILEPCHDVLSMALISSHWTPNLRSFIITQTLISNLKHFNGRIPLFWNFLKIFLSIENRLFSDKIYTDYSYLSLHSSQFLPS